MLTRLKMLTTVARSRDLLLAAFAGSEWKIINKLFMTEMKKK